ncbi:N-acetylglucosamine-specific PTS transporter subunit IIBC [Paludibacterium paludis]|uniref:PTS N-acetylglucosamine transporter subunit IIABC n=1 Tax=Paludibacterium paludis TaxID=1225769 RepID=A0A918P1D1_9NEIS|nr:N-acetylglucosamine-specific PTS transporter subunit IIBC [Paludibacterium paludis]GGY13415.1 PTS N-acetylglucosamine transporter subunit IIABC [Paludibacterium paludis]
MNLSKFAGIQQLGRALMLPIAVLPIAGLLLRLGQEDLLNIAVMAQAGNAIFSNLALIFAIGVAVGFAKDNNGTAGLAGAIGYLVLTAVLKASPDWLLLMSTKLQGMQAEGPAEFLRWFVHLDGKGKPIAPDMSVLAGILSGVVAGLLYNRYKDVKLPSYLAFFGGKRFVPIVTGFTLLLAGIVLGFVWPPIQQVIDQIGHWLLDAGSLGLFVYGVLNRLLIVTGLHHILNSLVWFVFGSFTDPAGKVVAGDLWRFFAGDPTAGRFMAGFFPVMMFGLPAACLAMYRNARPENRKAVGGLLLSMALTAFLTGVTEPVEFAFMFLAPVLYGVHAVLTGLSLAIMHILHVRLGFTFSAGLFDYILSFGKGQNAELLLPVGAAYFVVYYVVFDVFIRRFNLMTIGREENVVAPVAEISGTDRAREYVLALGGAANLVSVDACTTRLRLVVGNDGAINEPALKALGSRGIIKPAKNVVQIVIGPEADSVADEIRTSLGGATSGAQPVQAATVAEAADIDRTGWFAALGGQSNVRSLEAVAHSRLRVEVNDASGIDEAALRKLGALAVQPFSSGLIHVVLGGDASPVVSALNKH